MHCDGVGNEVAHGLQLLAAWDLCTRKNTCMEHNEMGSGATGQKISIPSTATYDRIRSQREKLSTEIRAGRIISVRFLTAMRPVLLVVVR